MSTYCQYWILFGFYFPALFVRPAAAEDGDTDGEEWHGDDDAGPGGVQGQPLTHGGAAIALVVTVPVLLYEK